MDLVTCRQVNIGVIIRNSLVNGVEMRAIIHLDFKDSVIPKLAWLVKIQKVFPNVKTVDVRGSGLCLVNSIPELKFKDDCR